MESKLAIGDKAVVIQGNKRIAHGRVTAISNRYVEIQDEDGWKGEWVDTTVYRVDHPAVLAMVFGR